MRRRRVKSEEMRRRRVKSEEMRRRSGASGKNGPADSESP
jgi:hypothetical protein